MQKVRDLLTKFLNAASLLKGRVQFFLAKLDLKNLTFKKSVPFLLIGLFAVLAVSSLVSVYKKVNASSIEIAGAKAQTLINKEFSFPLKDDKGVEVAKIKYVIENAEERDEIVVKGQKARSVKGRTFLIFNIKIVNDHTQLVQIQTRDYVRLSVNGNKNEWRAPDIHNDPVEVQAISTKLTRVGFAISNDDKDFVLRVGEINGEKIELPVSFK